MKKILLAFDDGAAARKALETTAELAQLSGASVSVLGVVPPPLSGTEWPEALSGWDPSDAFAATLDRAQRYLAERGVAAEALEVAGDPAQMIEQVADAGGWDTIVVGSRGHGAVRRLFEGSVSSHVASHALQPVLVVR